MFGRRRIKFFRDRVARFFGDNPISLTPWRQELQGIRPQGLRSDLIAAFNVALLALPQGMAYAAIAELPIIYGIVCSALAAIISPFFASSRFTILGPTNATAFMVFSFFAVSSDPMSGALNARQLELMPLLVLMVGVICAVGALFKIADLLQYVSRSVLVGYITGAAVLIIANQFKHLLGIELSGRTFFSIISSVFGQLSATEWQPLVIGLGTLALYFILQRFAPKLPNFAIVLTLVSALSVWIGQAFPTSGFADVVRFSAFSLEQIAPSVPGVASSSLLDDIGLLLNIALALAFVASLENTVMAKSLASQTGDSPDVNQDMLSVGMANIATSFLAPMPASGSLTRSALNFASGAHSRLASLICGVICTVGLFLLAAVSLVEWIPKACLAALVIAVAISLIKPSAIRICLLSTTSDAVVLCVTFLAALFAPLYVAIFIGVAISIIFFLKKASRPYLVEYGLDEEGTFHELKTGDRPNPAISIVHVEGDLFFGAAELFRSQMQSFLVDPNLKVIILRLKNARHLDATSVLSMGELISAARRNGRHVLVSGATREVYRVLKNSGILEVLQEGCDRSEHESNVFPFTPLNPNISSRNALLRAQKLLGTKSADIRIFYDPTRK